MRLNKTSAILLLALGILLAATVSTAGRLEVRNQAYEAMDKYEDQGFSIRELQIGILQAGEPYYFDTQLSGGVEYVFYAAGDEGLTGVYIEIYDENWALIAESLDAETAAEAEFTPDWSGLYHVKVDMNGQGGGEAYWFIISGYK